MTRSTRLWARPSLALASFLFVHGAQLAAAEAAGGQLELPEVPDAPTEVVAEHGDSPVYYRLPNNTLSGWSRAVIGSSSRLGVQGERAQTCFSLGFFGGADIGVSRTSSLSFIAEMGYHYVYESRHWLVVGMGPALRRLGPAVFGNEDDEPLRPMGALGLALIPHGVVGSYDGFLAYGVRTSLIVRYFTAGLVLAHQYAQVHSLDRAIHEIQFGFTTAYSGADYD